MDDSQKRKSRLEIGHVLFIDIAGYSTLTTEEESETEIKASCELRITGNVDEKNVAEFEP